MSSTQEIDPALKQILDLTGISRAAELLQEAVDQRLLHLIEQRRTALSHAIQNLDEGDEDVDSEVVFELFDPLFEHSAEIAQVHHKETDRKSALRGFARKNRRQVVTTDNGGTVRINRKTYG